MFRHRHLRAGAGRGRCRGCVAAPRRRSRAARWRSLWSEDMFDTTGVPTGWGVEPYGDRFPVTDATIVRKLRAAGAVLFGKTTVGALASDDTDGGWTRNPWNLNEGSSGSSAGSASATAAGLCAFSIGTETLGSSPRPASVAARRGFGRPSAASPSPAPCRCAGRSTRSGRSPRRRRHRGRARRDRRRGPRRSLLVEAPFGFDAEADISRTETRLSFREPLAKARRRSIMPRSRHAGVSVSRSSKFRCLPCPMKRS